MAKRYRKPPRVSAERRRHNLRPTADSAALPGTKILFERRRPGPGYRHVLSKSDIARFIALLPDWDELSRGLEGIVLMPGEADLEGMCFETWVAVFAWRRELWDYYQASYLEHPRPSITRLGVPVEPGGGGGLVMKWTEGTVRAYQLLDVLLHELGHHHDRMTTRAQEHVCRGEPYAERYAARYADRIWGAYISEFGLT
jgi:hypothetical protein